MKLFNSIAHMLAWLLKKAIPKAEQEVTAVEKIAGPVAGALAQALAGKGAQAEAVVYALAGSALKALSDAGGVISSDGLNIQLDTEIVPDVLNLYQQVAALFAKNKPATEKA